MKMTEEKKASRRDVIKIAGTGIAGLVVGAAAGYLGKPTPSPPPIANARALGRFGGIVKVGQEGEPPELDPQVSSVYDSFWVETHIFEGLIKYDFDFSFLPALAEWWEMPNSKTYIFHLKKGVKFHNGRDMTSDDVKFSFERVMDPKTGSPTRQFLTPIASIDTPDDYTVTLNLNTVDAPLMSKLAENWGTRVAIVPKEAVDTLKTEPVGTGPFKFKEWIKGDHITLERFDDYWDPGLPYPNQLQFYFQPDAEAMWTMLKTNTTDFIDPVAFTHVNEADTKDTRLLVPSMLGFHWLWMNSLSDSPFKYLKVRQAVAESIDRAEICNLALYGFASPTDSPLLAGTPWAVPVPAYKYDPEDAEALLAAAGYKDGFDDTIIAAPTAEERKIAEVAADQLRKVGIRLTVSTPEISTYLDEVFTKRTYHIADCGWTPPPEPDIILGGFFATGGSLNFGGFSDPDVDTLLAQGRQELDRAKRKIIYQTVLEKAIPQATQVFIEQLNRPMGIWRHLHGYEPRADLAKMFTEVWTEIR
jgi:peptide/nickel transport system substrate-binding protein